MNRIVKTPNLNKMPPYKCQLCSNIFIRLLNLKHHVTLAHTCTVCPYEFKKNETLQDHFRKAHSKEPISEKIVTKEPKEVKAIR